MAHRFSLTTAWRYPAELALLGCVVAGVFACSGAASDSVAPPPPGGTAASIAITPNAPPAVTLGAQIALQASVHDDGGNIVPDAQVFWSSHDTTVATVSSAGVVTGTGIGSTQVAASFGGQSAVVPVAVVPVAVASVAIAPASANVTVGATVALQAVTYNAGGTVLTGRSVVWASSASQVATVDANGKVTGVSAGTATITATSEGKTGSASVVVSLVPVASVSVAPSSASIKVGESASLSAVTTDAHGNVLSGRTITWSSANSSIATVSALGLVQGVAAGTTTITATSEGKEGAAQVVVTAASAPPPPPPPPTAAVASVRVSPATVTLTGTHTQTLTASALDADGNELTGRTITWSTSGSTAVKVTQTGPTTASVKGSGRQSGITVVTATCEGVSGSSIVTFIN